MIKRSVFIMMFCLYVSVVHSQIKSIGTYPIKNFRLIDNKLLATTNAIVQDRNGLMIFGNNKGIILFDGSNWQIIRLPNNSTVNSLATDSAGTIYVGGHG